MHLRYLRTLIEPSDGQNKITALSWSPNRQKLAAAAADRLIYLFDEAGDKRDRFRTKPADPEVPTGYLVWGMTFSPDAAKLAIAQSDGMVFVYRLGAEWGDRKSICAKFSCSSPITCLIWPVSLGECLYFGALDGQMRVGQLKLNRTENLFKQLENTPILALAGSVDGKSLISGHADGLICRYDLKQIAGSVVRKVLVRHACSVEVLAWGEAIVAAGPDGKVCLYTESGDTVQNFFISSPRSAAISPTGQQFLIGSQGALTGFSMQSINLWASSQAMQVPRLHGVTALCWSPEGSSFALGTLSGCVMLYSTCLKCMLYKNTFEITQSTFSTANIRHLMTGQSTSITSLLGHPITKFDIYQQRFMVAKTPKSLVISDFIGNLTGEILWAGSGKERFYFANPQVCGIYDAGEFSIVEFGSSEVLGSCRMRRISPHTISIRLQGSEAHAKACIIAHLEGRKNIHVINLVTGASLASINHDAKVDWLELNFSATHLLYRDESASVHLHTIASAESQILLKNCSYCQWAPDLDVIVAQSGGTLHVWYSALCPGSSVTVSIPGTVESITSVKGKMEVLCREGSRNLVHALDTNLIRLGQNLAQGGLREAYSIVTLLPNGPKTVMWQMIAEAALARRDLEMLALCHEKMGNADDALQVRQIQLRAQAEGWAAGDVRLAVALAQISQQWGAAERLLLSQGDAGPAVEMYRSLGMLKDAVRVAAAAKHPSLLQLINYLVSHFSKEGRFNEAAALLLKHGNVRDAMESYLKAGMPQQAAQIALNSTIPVDEHDIKRIMADLEAAGLHELVGDLLMRQHRFLEALEAFKKARAYNKAVDLAARHEPGAVAGLHEEWGGWLVMNGQAEAAVHQFLKAGDSTAAVEAALSARQLETAAAILDREDVRAAAPLYRRVAAGCEASRQLDNAQRYYIKAGLPVEAAQMWLRAKQWARAVHVASQHLPDTDAHELFVGHARALEAQERWEDAESAWVAAGDPGLAVAMHRRNGDLAAMFRAVTQHQPERLADTHAGMAQELEAVGDLKGAEAHFVEAGQWQAAADMYARSATWEDALRVAKAHGGTAAHDQVAIAWASSCNPQEAVTILARLDLLEAAIDAALTANNFQHALDVASAAVPALLPEVHLRHAIFLEDKGHCKDAEQEFLLAGQPMEAIDMWLHQKNWPAAREVCQAHHPSGLASVLKAQARAAREEGDVAHAEALYLGIGQFELALEMHQELGDWDAALRFAEQHLPHKVAQIRARLQPESAEALRQPESALVTHAEALEAEGSWSKAIDAYLSVTQQHVHDQDRQIEMWGHALRIAETKKHARLAEVAAKIGRRLQRMGQYEKAGQLLLGSGDAKGAVETFLLGSLFGNARAAAGQDKTLRISVEEAHMRCGGPTAAELLEAGAAEMVLPMYASAGHWQLVHDVAAGLDASVRDDYLIRHAKALMHQEQPEQAAAVLAHYRPPKAAEHYQLYHSIAKVLLHKLLGTATGKDLEDTALSPCHRFLHGLLVDAKANQTDHTVAKQGLRDAWQAVHYSILHSRSVKQGWHGLAAKQATSLLRFCGLVPADWAYATAGIAWRVAGAANMALIVLNRYLDIAEAIEDGLPHMHLEQVQGGNLPGKLPLPQNQSLTVTQRAEVREWVIAASLDPTISQQGSLRSCKACQSETFEANVVCHQCGTESEPCAISGYPINKAEALFLTHGGAKFVVRQPDWQQYTQHYNVCPVTGIELRPS